MSGLRINSVSDNLAAMFQVQRTSSRLAETLTQLSTGSRINSAKDDPAGLIAQELLRSEITATNAAMKNTRMADSMLAVADSGMRQISNLLIEAKGLAVEAANTGAMSSEMIAANQLQIDEILNSIDRVSGMVRWMDQPLLDGSLSSENGGATFQLGPDVVSSQQVQVPIEATTTSRLGLLDLKSGGSAALATNPGLADGILNSAIEQVAVQRGALGAVQKYTLESNLDVLQQSLVQLTAAVSLISDTDFAEASSNLVRDQILLQAGIQTLGIVNQLPRYAASLLGS